ncbi:MAG: DEAD/DEAH box helicase, partial [Lachnospiraceae bacterium]|nr:DEAD/DEAH box helicase [Lachnospiraceae bacterium]
MFDLKGLKVFNEIKSALGSGVIRVTGCVPSQLEHMIWQLGDGFDAKVIITFDEPKAMDILSSYKAFDDNGVYYPAKDPVFDKADIRGTYLSEQRLEITKRLFDKENLTVITTLDAFSEELSSFREISNDLITIKTGDTVNMEELAKRLVELGYENESQVGAHGEFSLRGNIIDIFPYTQDAPFRIDLWGDEVEKIKMFDVESQRSIETVEEFTVFPGGEKGNSATFFDYFPENTLYIFDEPAKVFDQFLFEETLPEEFKKRTCLLFSMLDTACEELPEDEKFFVKTRNIPSYNGRFEDLINDLKRYKEQNWTVYLYTASQIRAERLQNELRDNGVELQVSVGNIRTGFEYPGIHCSVITEVDIFGARRKNRKKRRRYSGDPIKDFTDLSIGDYVVHEHHGVGVYRGIERMTMDGVEKDYMKIDYANNASLYVLATQFDKIQKYSSAEGTKPKINKLGGKEWNNTKAKVRSAVKDIAAELVRLYAVRQAKQGYRYMPDTVWQREFEDEFEFEETDDQLRAIEAVKEDMESSKIMDRLICGDVGFGKTEVAIRAAFKAVQEGKQVAFLVPTTILAQQHYNTFVRRMANYPVVVKMLSRFVTAGEQKKVVADMKKGMVDIVIGTHRLLSKDIEFKDLGLLIIDEEQRFGVSHKEKIKQIRKDVDVLTLSATPIPRTLHMSLAGIRD